jgi:hypothetical protein
VWLLLPPLPPLLVAVARRPVLAHGIGMNTCEAPRLAVYCRLSGNSHPKNRKKIKRKPDADDLARMVWTGDMFHLTPGAII